MPLPLSSTSACGMRAMAASSSNVKRGHVRENEQHAPHVLQSKIAKLTGRSSMP
jgi:hypothetical protein